MSMMPKRTAPQPDPDAFARMSRELECDESEEQFERVFAKVVKPSAPAARRPQAEPPQAQKRKKPSPNR